MRSTWVSATSSRRALALLVLLGIAGLPGAGLARVFLSRSEALQLAFPGADRVEDKTWILADAQVSRIQDLSGAPVESRLVRIYTGWSGDQVIGYAIIDQHNVRTLPEAFIVVLDPEGRVRMVKVLAFHEPPEYLPSERWYGQFEGRGADEPLRLGRDVHGVTGATLSARATTRGVKRVLALYRVVLRGTEEP
jgi:hypothetical protein